MKSADRYCIEGDFEAGVVYYLASSKGFFLRFAKHLCGSSGKDGVDLFSSVYAQTLVELMLTEYTRNDVVPGSVAIVGNMLSQHRNKGKLKESARTSCQAYLDFTLLSATDEDDTAAQFAVLVKDWLHWKATHLAIDLTADRKDISALIEVLEDANSVLVPKVTGYTSARADDIATWVKLIKKSGDLDKLPTGITSWDGFLDGGLSKGTLGIIIAPTGCHRKGQRLLMADGSVKAAEDVVVGDKLCGPSGPRTVLRLCRGVGEMAEIVPVKGDPWVVNLDHVLTLSNTRSGALIDVTVRKWISWSQNRKDTHKLIRVPPDGRHDTTYMSVRLLQDLEPYYGFTLDGDGRYLLEDFTITHNSGKSLVLSQMAASALLRGIDTVYISLEIDDSQVAARTYAAMAGLPIDLVVKGSDFIEPYLIRAFKRSNVTPGRFHLEEFPEGISVNEMFVTLDKTLRKEDHNPQLYLIDYLDRFGGGRRADGKLSGYEHGRDVTQAVRNYMHKNKKHGWSACQSKRFASKADYKTADVDAAADSAHKTRISDVVANILFNKDGPGGVDEIASKISKHRSGKGAGKSTAFRPVDYTYGIVFPSKDFDPIPYEILKNDPNFRNFIAPDY